MTAIERRSEPDRADDPGSLVMLLALIGLLMSIPIVHCGEYVMTNCPASIAIVSCESANIGLEPTSCSSVVEGILRVDITEVGKWQKKYDICSVINYDDEDIGVLGVSWTGNLSLVIDRVDVKPSSIKSGHSSSVSLFTSKNADVGAYVGDILLSFQDNQGSETVEILISVNMVLTG